MWRNVDALKCALDCRSNKGEWIFCSASLESLVQVAVSEWRGYYIDLFMPVRKTLIIARKMS